MQYLKEFIKEAMDNSDRTPIGITSYLEKMKKPGRFSKTEKKEAYSRVRKVFKTNQERPLWFVLSCLGLKEKDFEETTSS